jgi:molybdopterin-containing oxidoreductase family membrane subunit
LSPDAPDKTAAVQRASPFLGPGHSYASVTDKISSIVLVEGTRKGWVLGFAIAFALIMVFNMAVAYLLYIGVGIWGINIPIGWGFAIVNFVWWIGIGHAGTLISAFLLLMRQAWRQSINRFAEAMTLFAVACAGMFPLLHMGRPWLFYWLVPYPDTMGTWPQFRSPLVWDVFAVSTYATISLPIWPRCAIAPRSAWLKLFTAYLPWAGAARPYTGAIMKWLPCCSRGWPRRWLSLSTRS